MSVPITLFVSVKYITEEQLKQLAKILNANHLLEQMKQNTISISFGGVNSDGYTNNCHYHLKLKNR